jgi:hypothetical protein
MDGVKPDASVKEPCAATCASCPNAVKGSKITPDGKATTACAPFKRVSVVPSGTIVKSKPLLLRLAQTSVWDKDNKENEGQGWYAWDQYLDMLRARGAKHTAAVETRVKFDLRVQYPKLLFSASRWLNPDEAAAAKQKLADDAEAIKKILMGAGNDGAAGQPGVSPEGTDPMDTEAAAPAQGTRNPAAAASEAAAAVAAAQAAAAAQAEAEKKAAAKAARQQKAQEAAKAAAAAAAAAAAELAAADADDGFGGGFDAGVTDVVATVAAAAPAPVVAPVVAPAAAPVAAVVESGTPDGLKALLEGWDDNE